MPYDAERDEYTCAQGRKLKAAYTKKRKSENGYEQEVTVYECENCEGCPVKEKCIRQKKTDKIWYDPPKVDNGNIQSLF
jgi:hypothetical protein